MSKQSILSILFGLMLISSPVFAQKGKIKKAYSYLEALDYQSAVDLLMPLAEGEDNAEVAYLLGTIFRKQNSYNRAAVWYEKAVKLPDAPPTAYLYYGMSLLHINKCEEAQEQLDYFFSLKPLDPRQFQLKDACSYRQELLRKGNDSLEVQVLAFNSVLNDIGPAFYRSGLVFGSVRTPASGTPDRKVDPFYDLYYANMEEGRFQFSEPQSFSSQINSRVHEAIATFSQDGSTIYFTRNKGVDNEHSSATATGLEIVYAVSEDGNRWGELQLLPFNSPKYSIAHPSLSPDGSMLFFSSDMPGGYGGKDIYVTRRQGDHWDAPANLGPLVNTDGDEMFPYYHASGKLYFSSDGQAGLGGQDIFSTEPNKAGIWANIENFGAPINTEFDDYGIIVSREGDYGYFTSNRPGGLGKDDIYGFIRLGMEEPLVTQATPPQAEQNKVVVHVQVIDGANGQRIENPDIRNCEANLYRSVGTSSFQMNLYPGDCCEIAVAAAGYEPTKIEICGDPDNRNRAVVLEKIKVPAQPEPRDITTKNVSPEPGPASVAPPVEIPAEIATAKAEPEKVPEPVEIPAETATAKAEPEKIPEPVEIPAETATAKAEPEKIPEPVETPAETATAKAEPEKIPEPVETPAETATAKAEPEKIPEPVAEKKQPAPVEESISFTEEVVTGTIQKAAPEPQEEKVLPVSNVAATEDPEVEPAPSVGVVEETTEIVRQTTRARKTTKYLIGTVYDPLNSKPIPYAIIHLLNSTCGVNVRIESDASGHYRLPLMPDCCINIRVEKEGFQTYTALEALCTDKSGNIKGSTSILLKPDPKPKPQKINNETSMLISRGAFDGFERSKNTRTGDAAPAFILNVYYESGRTSVKEESVEDLKKLLKLLEENPTLIVEIGAHTDSNGSTTYNNDLSQRRAENVVKYLVSQGINAKRLQAKGYGETQLINDCTDDKECREEEHQVNRRTEFRIIGTLE